VEWLPSSVATLPWLKGYDIIETLLGEGSENDSGKASGKAFRTSASRVSHLPVLSARTSRHHPFVSYFSPETLPYFHRRYPAVRLNTSWHFNPRKHARFIPFRKERERERERKKLRAGRAAEALRLNYKRKKIYNPRMKFMHFALSIVKGCVDLSPVSSSLVESHFLASSCWKR